MRTTTWRSSSDRKKTYHPKHVTYGLNDKIGFGKFYHKTVGEVLMKDSWYIRFMIRVGYKFDTKVMTIYKAITL